MRIVILGGAGFLGKKLASELLHRGQIAWKGGKLQPINKLLLFDKIPAADLPVDPRLEIIQGDIGYAKTLESLMEPSPQLIFHLAAVVSGEAEKNFDLGMQVNLQASLNLLELCRQMSPTPLLVFASSCAVFGGALTETIDDHSAPSPQSSYGTQKAVVDLLINDYSRRGFIDGRALRLPTIAIRPGAPNAATSSFVSSIIREPLQGKSAICPVSADTKVWILSPQKVTENFIHAAELKASDLGDSRIVNLPGITTTVEEMIGCLGELAGKETIDYIQWKPDKFIQSIVLTWPPQFKTDRALDLGFSCDDSVSQIIQSHIEEMS